MMSNTQNVESVAHRASEEASQVAGSAREAATEVVSTAADQAMGVVGDVKSQAHSIVDQAATELRTQADAKSTDAASRLRTLAGEMDALAQGRPQEAAQLTRYLGDAHGRVERYASRLEERGAQGVIDDVSTFARRRPGMFLLCSVGAGFALGRLLRSGAAVSQEQNSGSSNGEYEGRFADVAMPSVSTASGESTYGDGIIPPVGSGVTSVTPEDAVAWEGEGR
jgi:hypothetical protein